MISLRHAWAFLTRLPCGAHPAGDPALGKSVPWFPVVGAAIGLLVGLAYAGGNELFSPMTAAVIAIALGIAVTGAFHEDGLADTADSLGGYNSEQRLEIMKDSRVGTFGVLALVLSVFARVVALAQLRSGDGLLSLILAHTVGRSVATMVMTSESAARDGLGQSYAQHLHRPKVLATGVAVVGSATALGPAAMTGYLTASTLAIFLVILARRAYGGMTGDVLGAIEQLGEIAVLIAAARLVREFGWQWA